MRILIAEDHEKLASALASGLRREGFAVDLAADGEGALSLATANDYDVVLLDRDLPLLHGDEVCRRLVGSELRTRILMLTAASGVGDRVEGLDLGADDYLIKPFAFAELVARVRALARRSRPAAPPILRADDLVLDPARRCVQRAGRRLELGPKEFAVLHLLLSAQGAVLSQEDLLERAWDEAADPFSQTVRVTISRLRAKLGDPPLIETVPGGGYRI